MLLNTKISSAAKWGGIGALAIGLCLPVFAQDRDRDFDHHDWDRDHLTRVERGSIIAVRTDQFIDSDRGSDRVYWGTVDQDVRGENGRLAIPRGARVEMVVRVAPDNDLVLDLQSVRVGDHRYAVDAAPDRIQSNKDTGIVGAIVGAINGGQVRGSEVRVPSGTVLRSE